MNISDLLLQIFVLPSWFFTIIFCICCVSCLSCLSAVFIMKFNFFCNCLKLTIISQIFHQNNFLGLLKRFFLPVMLLILAYLKSYYIILYYTVIYYTKLRAALQSSSTIPETSRGFWFFSEELSSSTAGSFQIPTYTTWLWNTVLLI